MDQEEVRRTCPGRSSSLCKGGPGPNEFGRDLACQWLKAKGRAEAAGEGRLGQPMKALGAPWGFLLGQWGSVGGSERARGQPRWVFWSLSTLEWWEGGMHRADADLEAGRPASHARSEVMRT